MPTEQIDLFAQDVRHCKAPEYIASDNNQGRYLNTKSFEAEIRLEVLLKANLQIYTRAYLKHVHAEFPSVFCAKGVSKDCENAAGGLPCVPIRSPAPQSSRWTALSDVWKIFEAGQVYENVVSRFVNIKLRYVMQLNLRRRLTRKNVL